MNDPPHLLRPTRQTSGQSPTRNRVADDILAQLTPPGAVDALASATGPLRTCLDGSSAAERDFAMRTAMASKAIWEWVGELEDWAWPSEGGSAGFEMPSGKRRKISIEVTAPEESHGGYVGSLLAEDFAKYERRMHDIQREMNNLEVEDIKSQVMTNHILPLSRPSTPMSDSGYMGMTSRSTYNKMDDLTAVVTAIVVQTLPNLAKLYRLLQVWGIRLSVLQQVSPLLMAIEDAEVALQSGWNAIAVKAKRGETTETESEQPQPPPLEQADFDVMRKVLQKKISKPGRSLDYMLDSLEGQADTLPDQWLDRMETVERSYGDWVAACEKRIRETQWAKIGRLRQATKPEPPEELGNTEQRTEDDSYMEEDTSMMDRNAAVTFPIPETSDQVEEPSKKVRDARADLISAEVAEPFVPEEMLASELAKHSADRNAPVPIDFDGTSDAAFEAQVQPPTPTPMGRSKNVAVDGASPWDPEDNICSPNQENGFIEEDGDLELPPLRDESRRQSVGSQTSTVIHGASSNFGADTSDGPEVSASPAIARDKVREAEYVGISPPSSPPLTPEGRDPDSPPSDSPRTTIAPDNDDSLLMKPSLDDSFQDDFDDSISLSEYAHPQERRDSVGDQHLRQQLSEIIESIPAKIKLSNEPPAINLNPPDLQLPRIRKKPSIDRFRRSTSAMSAMSSRTATPSFTLSPAKNSRARSNRNQQEIKVYHLSRSTGEAPIKLFIRCVGENGERVMVRVGGGWADLSEYLKDYASHHGRRSKGAEKAKVEVRDVPRVASGRGPETGSSPPSRPASALELGPSTPLAVRKTRKSIGAANSEAPKFQPKTPAGAARQMEAIPSSEGSNRSRSSSRLSWVEEDSSFLGLAGPSGKQVEMSEENKAWVESVKEKVRLASGERRVSGTADDMKRFGEMGKVGGTKRLFRKSDVVRDAKK